MWHRYHLGMSQPAQSSSWIHILHIFTYLFIYELLVLDILYTVILLVYLYTQYLKHMYLSWERDSSNMAFPSIFLSC